MSNTILIDGYNLMHQLPELRKLLERDMELARQLLVRQLSEYAALKGCRMIVVFDGDARTHDPFDSVPNVQVLFSQLPEKADPFIKRLIEEHRRENLLVVSSDNEIIQHARLYGAHSVKSQSFAHQMEEEQDQTGDIEKKFQHTMDEDELQEWMDIFQNKGDKNQDVENREEA